ncbi:hypothetical protein AC792_10390 [Arthrobacter sp. RIT-PI-e]|nr:hypothetical protein AC792_10390 [Arthrobacter sp. RIT-PI-e]
MPAAARLHSFPSTPAPLNTPGTAGFDQVPVFATGPAVRRTTKVESASVSGRRSARGTRSSARGEDIQSAPRVRKRHVVQVGKCPRSGSHRDDDRCLQRCGHHRFHRPLYHYGFHLSGPTTHGGGNVDRSE